MAAFLGNLDALFEQAEFFIDAVSGYGSDFALFPEFFTAPLMADHLSEAEAIRELARHTEAVNYVFKNLLFRTTSILSLECLL
jgi:predicted amidohydrolase